MTAKQWKDSFKLALIKRESKKLQSLVFIIPQSEDLDELKSMQTLISEAIDYVTYEKDQLSIKLEKVRKTKEYLA